MVGGLHSMRLMRSLDGMSGWMEEEWWIGLDRLVCNNILAGGFFFFEECGWLGNCILENFSVPGETDHQSLLLV